VVRWRENGVRRCSPSYETRELAEKVRAKIVADIQAGRAGLPADPSASPTLGALGEEVIKRRKATHRAWADDRGRWDNHLEPFFGKTAANKVDAAQVRAFIEKKLGELNPATIGHCVKLLSSIYTDLIERTVVTGVTSNPVRSLHRATRKLYKPTHDPKNTPFIESVAKIDEVRSALPETISVMFAVGVYAGLRPGEIKGLHWEDVDLENRRMKIWRQVVRGSMGPLKDDETRVVPILNKLKPILDQWHDKTGGAGQLFRPLKKGGGRVGRPSSFVREHTLLRHLKDAREGCKLPVVTWYQATRHTFASQWVLSDGSIEKLASILGHSSTWVTERYAHLRPDLFKPRDLAMFDNEPKLAAVTPLPVVNPGAATARPAQTGTFGHAVVTTARLSEVSTTENAK